MTLLSRSLYVTKFFSSENTLFGAKHLLREVYVEDCVDCIEGRPGPGLTTSKGRYGCAAALYSNTSCGESSSCDTVVAPSSAIIISYSVFSYGKAFAVESGGTLTKG